MPLAGEQLTFGWALALSYHAGFQRKETLQTAVAIMCAESARFTQAFHNNLDENGSIKSTDWGLFQINDKAHPEIEVPAILNPITNATKAYEIFKGRGKRFTAWAAFNSGAYQQFLPDVKDAWDTNRWRNKLANVEKRFA